jgi:hypothetical protein
MARFDFTMEEPVIVHGVAYVGDWIYEVSPSRDELSGGRRRSSRRPGRFDGMGANSNMINEPMLNPMTGARVMKGCLGDANKKCCCIVGSYERGR